MPEYRRWFLPGGTFFFAVVTEGRKPILCTALGRRCLRAAIEETQRRWPFGLEAIVLLPDHLHAIWTLPANDVDFPNRWSFLKRTFTRQWLAGGGREQPRSESRRRHRRRGVWQRRFWEHCVRDEEDWRRHVDYIHYNPVKHGLAACPHAWPWSTFQRWVTRGFYETDWCCQCDGRVVARPTFEGLDKTAPEIGVGKTG